MSHPPPRIIEWFRADPWPRVRRVLLIGPGLLTLGGLVVAGSFLTRQPLSIRIDAAVVGLVLVAAGAIYTAFGMHKILRNDVVLALRTDGVVLQRADVETFVPWDELTAARWDASRGELVLARVTGEPIAVPRAFARTTGPALAGLIVATKRKVAMNLLR